MTASAQTSDSVVMVFDLAVGGHHGTYLLYLAKYWPAWAGSRLIFVVGSAFATTHPEVVAQAERHNVQMVYVHPDKDPNFTIDPRMTRVALLRRAFAEWQILAEHAKRFDVREVLVMYLDGILQGPLCFARPVPFRVSGIYFRPSFHYPRLSPSPLTRSERVRGLRQRLLLYVALRNRALRTVFSLDSYAVEHLRRLAPPRCGLVALPDPWDAAEGDRTPGKIRADLGISSSSHVFLILGRLTPRKGIETVLAALPLIEQECSKQIVLLIVGDLPSAFQTTFEDALLRAREATSAQITTVQQFVPEADLHAYFRAADVIMATYARHVGMSGILIHAAAAGRPVLSSDYGLMGALTRRFRLGVAINSTSPLAIARSMERFVTEGPRSLFDPHSAAKFASQNTAVNFAETIARHLQT